MSNLALFAVFLSAAAVLIAVGTLFATYFDEQSQEHRIGEAFEGVGDALGEQDEKIERLELVTGLKPSFKFGVQLDPNSMAQLGPQYSGTAVAPVGGTIHVGK